MSVVFFTRMVGMVVLAIVGYEIGHSISGPQPAYPANVWIISMFLAGGALGLLLGPYCTIHPYKWIRNQIKQLPANVLFPGAVGLLIGLVVAALLAFPLSMLPGELRRRRAIHARPLAPPCRRAIHELHWHLDKKPISQFKSPIWILKTP